MNEKRKLLIWLIILVIMVFVLRGSPQESKKYIILADSKNYAFIVDTEEIMINGKKYIAVQEEPNEEQTEDITAVIIIVVVILLLFSSLADTAQTGG